MDVMTQIALGGFGAGQEVRLHESPCNAKMEPFGTLNGLTFHVPKFRVKEVSG